MPEQLARLLFFNLDPKNIKSDRFLHVALHTIKLEALNPGGKWKIVTLVKDSSVSRTWIYENFGKNHQELLVLATKLVCEELSGVSQERLKIRNEHGALGNILRSRQMFMAFPEVLLFYYRTRFDKGVLGNIIRNSEKELRIIVRESIDLKDKELVKFLALAHGMATSLFLSDKEIEEIILV